LYHIFPAFEVALKYKRLRRIATSVTGKNNTKNMGVIKTKKRDAKTLGPFRNENIRIDTAITITIHLIHSDFLNLFISFFAGIIRRKIGADIIRFFTVPGFIKKSATPRRGFIKVCVATINHPNPRNIIHFLKLTAATLFSFIK